MFNTVGGVLQCTGNNPPPASSTNFASQKVGQCTS